MRIGIVGAGELGTGYGARLLEAGENVVFVARGDRFRELKEQGIHVAESDVAATKGLTATDDPAEAGIVELLLFCVKTYDLEEAAMHIRPMIGDETVVVPVQNGLYAPDRLVRILGPKSVVGGVAMGGIQIGELDGQVTERIRRVAETLNRAGFGAEIRPDIRVALWEKQLMACGASVVAAARLTPAQFIDSEETVAMYRAAMEEAAEIAKASGVALDPDLVDRYMESLDSPDGPRAVRPSMLKDLEAGRRLELEDWAGTAVRLGRELGIPTPVNSAVYGLLKPYISGAVAHQDRDYRPSAKMGHIWGLGNPRD